MPNQYGNYLDLAGIELFGEEGLAEDDLLAELDQLEADDAAKDLSGPIGTGAISSDAAA